MLSTQTIIKLLKPGYVWPLFLYLLPVSALLLADAYSLIYLSYEFGLYMVLAAAASVSLVGLLGTLSMLTHQIRLLRRSIYLSQRPAPRYRACASLLLASILFISPGAVSSALAVVCALPLIRAIPGGILTLLARRELAPVYDFLKMDDALAEPAPSGRERQQVPNETSISEAMDPSEQHSD